MSTELERNAIHSALVELRQVKAELAAREKRMREVAEELTAIIAKHPGWEPEALKLQPFMVPYATLTEWRAKLLEGIKKEDAS